MNTLVLMSPTYTYISLISISSTCILLTRLKKILFLDISAYIRTILYLSPLFSRVYILTKSHQTPHTSRRSFGPFWSILRKVVEQVAAVQGDLVTTWQELIKEVNKYSEEQHRKYRAVSGDM